MTASRPARLASLLLVCTLALAACQSSEERAEGHYQSALELMAEGDVQRALVELRNVFDLDGSHREARTLYAGTLMELGRERDAYGQYLRLVEQYPDDLDARLALARIAIGAQDWSEVRRHGGAALQLAPDAPEVQAVAVNIDYADALEAGDASARREVVRRAAALSEAQPEDLQLRRILVDGALRDDDVEGALAQVLAAKAVAPDERSLYDTEVSLLAQLGRADDLEAALRDMIARFPEDDAIVGNLVRFYLSRDETGTAETFLRERAASSGPETATARTIDLVRFLLAERGADAALAELDQVIATSETPDDFRSLRARILFDRGDTAPAIAEMEALLAEAADDDPDVNDDRVILARMLDATGNRVGAQRLVGLVLGTDATEIEALKLEAGWRIDADDADAAISLLRTALDESPQDVDALTLMARAHLRNGNRDLARDMLSLAVQASNSAAAETRRYVELLIEDERFQLAEEVLIDALRIAPDNLGLLIDLGELYIRTEDWGRTRQIEAQMRRLGTAAALRSADGLQAARLSSEGRTEETIAFLEDLAAQNTGDIAARIAVVRARLANGDTEGALSYAEQAVADAPDSMPLVMIYAATLSAVGRPEEAEENYRKVLAQDDQIETVWIGLVRSIYAQGDIEGARAALAEGLEALPDALNLLWAQASFRERAGDFEGALEIYESLYERAPNAPVVANNYASMLSTMRDDDASLERAYAVARRLRDAEEAPFRDTYGWIAYRRGDYQSALRHLEPAAEELSGDPLVQYHLAATYEALGREAEALAQYRAALVLVGEGETRPQFAEARAKVEALEARLGPAAAPQDAAPTEAAPAEAAPAGEAPTSAPAPESDPAADAAEDAATDGN